MMADLYPLGVSQLVYVGGLGLNLWFIFRLILMNYEEDTALKGFGVKSGHRFMQDNDP